MRRFVKRRSFVAHVAPTQIICQNEDDVRPRFVGRLSGAFGTVGAKHRDEEGASGKNQMLSHWNSLKRVDIVSSRSGNASVAGRGEQLGGIIAAQLASLSLVMSSSPLATYSSGSQVSLNFAIARSHNMRSAPAFRSIFSAISSNVSPCRFR